jgi:rhamnose transport system permease protein
MNTTVLPLMTSPISTTGRRHWSQWFASHRETSLVVVLAITVLSTALANPRFLSAQSIRDIVLNVCIIALLTVGLTVVMLMRHIDLSISSVVGLSAFLVGDVFTRYPQTHILTAVAIGLLIGLLAGAVNGMLVTWGRVPSLVATLSTLYIFRGIDYAWVQGRQINATSLPPEMTVLGSGDFMGMPYMAMIAGVLLMAVSYYLTNFRGGREFYAIGSNPEGARLAGVDVGRREFSGFLICGAIAGLAGVLWLARFGTVNASSATGIELQVVAAAVVGSVSIAGGSGSVLGAILGAMLLAVMASALVILRVSAFWQLAIQGSLILLAIAADTLLSRAIAAQSLKKRDHG